jgi:hypothetical protein
MSPTEVSSSRAFTLRAGGRSARLAAVLLAATLAGCATLAGRQATPVSSPTSAGQAVAAWPGGVMLPAGQRDAALTSGNSGWVVSRLLGSGDLVLTTVSLADGATSTSTLEKSAPGGFTGGGLAADESGHLWITYGPEVIRVDEPGGAIRKWTLPDPPPDAAPSDQQPDAGTAEAAAWDALTGTLVFVRNGDHRLYRFDPATGNVSVLLSVPLVTSDISRLTVGPDGSMTVTGSQIDAKVFTPTAVLVSVQSPTPAVLTNVLAICRSQLGLAQLDTAGDITLPDSSTTPLGQVSALPTNVPFTCDPSGNVFTLFVAKGSATVYRLSATGSLSTAQLPLIPVEVQSIGGVVSSWGDPRLVKLLPDGNGGRLAGVGTWNADRGRSFPRRTGVPKPVARFISHLAARRARRLGQYPSATVSMPTELESRPLQLGACIGHTDRLIG